MSFSELSCSEFTEVLSSKEPVPGGGGASALAGALGAALGNMVVSLTVGKKKYAGLEERMQELSEKCTSLREEFLSLIDKDAEVFEPLSKAYALPKSTEEERSQKAAVLETALRNACTVPLQIMEKCCETIELIKEIAETGSAMAVSDAGAGALLCSAALQSAGLDVYINTKSMNDREYAGSLNDRTDEMLKEYTAEADEIYQSVLERIRK